MSEFIYTLTPNDIVLALFGLMCLKVLFGIKLPWERKQLEKEVKRLRELNTRQARELNILKEQRDHDKQYSPGHFYSSTKITTTPAPKVKYPSAACTAFMKQSGMPTAEPDTTVKAPKLVKNSAKKNIRRGKLK